MAIKSDQVRNYLRSLAPGAEIKRETIIKRFKIDPSELTKILKEFSNKKFKIFRAPSPIKGEIITPITSKFQKLAKKLYGKNFKDLDKTARSRISSGRLTEKSKTPYVVEQELTKKLPDLNKKSQTVYGKNYLDLPKSQQQLIREEKIQRTVEGGSGTAQKFRKKVEKFYKDFIKKNKRPPQINEYAAAKFGTPSVKKIAATEGVIKIGEPIVSGSVAMKELREAPINKELLKLYKNSNIINTIKAGKRPLIKDVKKVLNSNRYVAENRMGQLLSALAGDRKVTGIKVMGGDQIRKMVNEWDYYTKQTRRLADLAIGKNVGEKTSLSAPRSYIAKDFAQRGIKGYNIDEPAGVISSYRQKSTPYGVFSQIVETPINTKLKASYDVLKSKNEAKVIQALASGEGVDEAINKFNNDVKRYEKLLNKNVKLGQPKVRLFEISLDAPENTIKNFNKLPQSYQNAFSKNYSQQGYSFKVPKDIQSIFKLAEKIKNPSVLTKLARLATSGAPRIMSFGALGLPVGIGYMAYQDLKKKEKESEPLVQTVRYDKTLGAFVNPADDVVSQASLLNWVAENPIKSVAGTTAPALLTKKGRALGKSALAKTAWLATPLPLAGSLALANQDRSASEMLSDPWNWAGVAAMDTATKATGLADKTGKLASAMRLGMSPGMIRGASRFLGLPGLALSLGMTAYDQYKKYQDKEGFVYDLFNEDVDTTSV